MLGIATLIGMGGIGIGIVELFQDQSTLELLEQAMPWYYQLFYGLAYGFGAAWLGWLLIRQEFMMEVRSFYEDMLRQMNMNLIDVLFISFCAGVGEELLFRAGIQYWLGIYITSILFVAIHGYLNPKDWKMSIYGMYLTIVMIGISHAFENFGLVYAMAAHFAIDVFLLQILTIDRQ